MNNLEIFQQSSNAQEDAELASLPSLEREIARGRIQKLRFSFAAQSAVLFVVCEHHSYLFRVREWHRMFTRRCLRVTQRKYVISHDCLFFVVECIITLFPHTHSQRHCALSVCVCVCVLPGIALVFECCVLAHPVFSVSVRGGIFARRFDFWQSSSFISLTNSAKNVAL